MIEKEEDFQSLETCDSEVSGCAAFQKLKEWQIDQYRMAVDQNMWYMGERLGRPVDWEEAEEDFLHNGYYGCAPQWRRQYCRSKCNHFNTCALGRQFTRK